MDNAKLVSMLVGLLIAVVMVGAVFVPVVQSSTTRTVTTEIENEGAEWLKLGYNQGTDYSFTVGFDGEDNFTVGTQTGEYKNLICYADNERTLFVSGDYWYLLTNGENPSVHKFTDTASVTNASGTLTITDGENTLYTGASPTWAYVPDANGVYGFFTEGGLILEEGKPTVAVGSYAGVFAYNDTVVAPNGYGDLGLTMSGNYADGEVIWIVAPSELDTLSVLPTDTLEPAVLDLDPISIQPIDLGGSGSVGLMVVPTPSYTDGYWGFELNNDIATIVSYSGPRGEITVPTKVTLNGVEYPVKIVGKGGTSETLVTNTGAPVKFIFSDGLEKINDQAFALLTTLQNNDLYIPDTVTYIGGATFRGTNISGNLIIPDSVTYIGQYAFGGCAYLDGYLKISDSLVAIPYDFARDCSSLTGSIVIPSSVTSVGNRAFSGCSSLDNLIIAGSPTFSTSALAMENVKEVLNLGTTSLTTTSYGLSAESIQDSVNALGYIAPVSITETDTTPIDSPVAGLMQLLPLIAGIGALFLAVATMIYTRF